MIAMVDLAPRIFSGSSNPELTKKIVKYLNLTEGVVSLKRFSDGEIWVKFKENIRGREVFIVQPTMPPADNFMELLIMLDAAKRSSAKSIIAVIPYFGYARQDRKDQPRVSITAKLTANLITAAGADRVITMDLHAAQIQGFFDIPTDHLYASPIFTNVLQENCKNFAVASADLGGIKLARSYAKRLHAPLIVIDKRRPKQNKAEVMHIIGEVKGKDILLVDDMIDTAGTFVTAITALKAEGARRIFGAITHPLLSGQAIQKLEDSELEKLYVSDSIPLVNGCSKIEVLSCAELMAESIIRIHNKESISSLFDIDKS